MNLNEIQNKVQVFVEENNMEMPLWSRMLDLISETGELSKEILLATEYGQVTPSFRPSFQDELGDVFFSLVALANQTGIDLEDTLNHALDKYSRRLKKGSAGSEND